MTGPAPAPPSRDELLAMAYVDGELDDTARVEFEARLATSSALRTEVTELRRLSVLARQAAPPEPMDHEWRAIAAEPLQRLLHPLGWLSFLFGSALLVGWTGWSFLRNEAVDTSAKAALGLALGGFALLLLLVLRNRLRTIAFDPYRDVHR